MASLCGVNVPRVKSLRGESLYVASLCGVNVPSLRGDTLRVESLTVIEASCNRSTADTCFDVTSSSTVYSAITSGTGCYTNGTYNVSGDGATAGNAAITGTGDVTASGAG